jgi:hypothetical protein
MKSETHHPFVPMYCSLVLLKTLFCPWYHSRLCVVFPKKSFCDQKLAKTLLQNKNPVVSDMDMLTLREHLSPVKKCQGASESREKLASDVGHVGTQGASESREKARTHSKKLFNNKIVRTNHVDNPPPWDVGTREDSTTKRPLKTRRISVPGYT